MLHSKEDISFDLYKTKMTFKPIKYLERRTGEEKQEYVPGEKYLKFLYYSPLGKLTLESIVKRKCLTSYYGRQMDSYSSCKKIKEFISNNNINMNEALNSIEEYQSFNEFFIRKLKNDSRPIAGDSTTLVSPADGKIFAFENLSEIKDFFVKGENFTLSEFLKDDNLAKKYENGSIIIIRLAPVDYHRLHFPTSGIIGASKQIKGYYYSVSTHAIRKNFRIFCENKREYSILKSDGFGNILISEIAATMVGGITQLYIPNTKIEKGEEKGYFSFGGSTTILLFEKDSIEIDKDLIENSRKNLETKVYMGEKIGAIKKKTF